MTTSNSTIEDLNHILKHHDEYEKKLETIFNLANEPFNDRMSAGILLVQSELGMRTRELCNLSRDCLHYDGQGTPRIKIKRAGRDSSFSIYCSPELEKRLKALLKLREQCPTAETSPYLYVLDKKGKGSEKKPVNPEYLNAKFKKFCGDDAKVYMLRLYRVWKLRTTGLPVKEIQKRLGHWVGKSSIVSYFSM